MRITKISVKGLFGMFDHEIPLNQESRITIVHGPNGVGKTESLRILHGLASFNCQLLGETTFERLWVEFDGGQRLIVSRQGEMDSFLLEYNDGTDTAFTPFVLTEDYRFMIALLQGVKLDEYCDELAGAELDLPVWIPCILKRLHVDFYGTRRLQSDTAEDEVDLWEGATRDIYNTKWFSKYALSGQQRVMMGRMIIDSSNKQFLSLALLVLLIPYGIVRKLAKLVDDLLFGLFSWITRPLVDRILDSEKLRQVEHENEIELLTEDSRVRRLLFEELINRRFQFVSLRYHQNAKYSKDYELLTRDGMTIDEYDLSSGEKHLLALYYHLIFIARRDSLVMIDEPELSLHVNWQRNFLKDLQRIIMQCNFDVLIATHSPQIVFDKWKWLVGLEHEFGDR